MANVLILENPGVSTSKERPWSPRAAEPETQKEACVTDNWKNHPAYIKTSQTEKTNSGFNYKPSIRSHNFKNKQILKQKKGGNYSLIPLLKLTYRICTSFIHSTGIY